MKGSLFAVFTAAVLATACGTDDLPTNTPDAASAPDAAASTNVLGIACTPGTNDCPSGQCVILNSGSDTSGYCSPTCSGDTECTTGYTGPSTGSPTCFNPTVPNTCTITCSAKADCPSALDCIMPMGAPQGFCVHP